MDSDNLAALALLIGSLVVLFTAVAAETCLHVFTNSRLRALADKGNSTASSLLHRLQERQPTVEAMALARNLGVLGGASATTYLVLDSYGLRFGPFLIALLGIVVGAWLAQALPRTLVLLNPNAWFTAMPKIITVISLVFRWPALLLNQPLNLFSHWRGIPTIQAEEDMDDLLQLVEEEASGEEHQMEREMIRKIVELEETTAREIMMPRIDIVAVELGTPLDEVVQTIIDRGFSRIPLYEESIDNIIGVIYAKDILGFLTNGRRPTNLRDIARTPYFIPEGKKVDELLAEMRHARVHMAIVVDEYGGTAGVVTIEDMLEEIVGEIADEYDISEEEPIQRLTETEAIIDARVSIDAINELFGLEIEGEDFDTVGGFVYHQLGKIPTVGDEVRVDGLTLRILTVLGHRIKKVRVTKGLQPVTVQDSE